MVTTIYILDGADVPITALAFNLELWLDSQRLGGQPNNHTNSETQIFNLVLWLDSQRRPYTSDYNIKKDSALHLFMCLR